MNQNEMFPPMNEADRQAVQCALTAWFRSQGVDPLDATLAMATMIGSIIGLMSYNDPASRREAINILCSKMVSSADVD
jgi:hypothetical protein